MLIFHYVMLYKLLGDFFGIAYFHVNVRVESTGVSLNLWLCICVLLHPQLMSYVKQYGIRH